MKRFSLLLLAGIGFFSLQTNAQNLKKGFKLLEKNQVKEARIIFDSAFKANVDCPAANYAISVILIKNTQPPEYFKSLNHAVWAFQGGYGIPLNKKYIKLKKYFTHESIGKWLTTVDSSLFVYMKKQTEMGIFNDFDKECKYSKHYREVMKIRDSIQFEQAKNTNSVEALDEFIVKYPTSMQKPKAQSLRNEIAYENVKKSNSINDYENFIQKYSDAEQVNEARNILINLVFQDVKKTNKLEYYEEFRNKYKDASSKILAYCDSTIASKKEMSAYLTDASNYRIFYLHNKDLWMMNEDGNGQTQLTKSYDILAFTCHPSGNYVYYGRVVGDVLDVYRVASDNSGIHEKVCTLGNRTKKNFFESEIDAGYGQFGFADDNTLVIRCNFFWGVYDMVGAYFIDLKTKKIDYYDGVNNMKPKRFKQNIRPELKVADPKSKPFFTKKTENEYDLFFINEKAENIRISQTEEFSNRDVWGEKSTDFFYYVLPSKKIIFSFISDCGDLCHGPSFIVNADGSKQQNFSGDLLDYANFSILNCNREAVILEDNNLYAYMGSENKKFMLACNIDYFETLPISKGSKNKSTSLTITPEQSPVYPGGEQAMNEFILKNIVYPPKAKDLGIKGTVYINFVIDAEGAVTDAKVIRGIGGGCDEEALRVMKIMPKWAPGTSNGKPVKVQMYLPVKFDIQ
ncbi:MAG: TonB family protein [Bacteroidota bacterium]